jgi:hypothetical protein
MSAPFSHWMYWFGSCSRMMFLDSVCEYAGKVEPPWRKVKGMLIFWWLMCSLWGMEGAGEHGRKA